jgi:hypothetical protein
MIQGEAGQDWEQRPPKKGLVYSDELKSRREALKIYEKSKKYKIQK